MMAAAFPHRTPPWRPWLTRGLWRLPPELAPGHVLLSFDDGPTENTARIAGALEERGLHGLFFLLGGRLPAAGTCGSSGQARAAGLARRLLHAGHLLGLHGLEHRRAVWRSPAALRRDWLEGLARIEAASGFRPRHARPPYGSWAPWLNGLPQRLGLRLVLWSLNPVDYAARDAASLAGRVLHRVRGGDILLLHCSGPGEATTLAALPALLEGLAARGLRPLEPTALLETDHA
jgi:peptidoglycan-N-acetylglucosamine deacetylase